MKPPRWWLGSLSLFLLVVLSASAADISPWKAGAARTNITPDQPLWMSGYGSRDKPAQGKLTDLWAKALALETFDGQRSVLVTMDLVGIERSLSVRIAREVEERFQIPRARLILSTSHTHTGPVVGANLRAMYFLDPEQQGLITAYEIRLSSQVVGLVGAALNDLGPSELKWGCGHATFATNRRNNREADITRLRDAGQLQGPIDHDVPLLAVYNAQQQLKVLLTGYACHATVLSSYEWSGDWPGFAQLALEERHPGALAMTWAGCGADQNPLPRREVALAKKYGAAIADAVDRVLKQEMKPVTNQLTASYAEIPLPFAQIPTRAELQSTLQSTNRYETNRAFHLMAELQARGMLEPTYPYPVQVWQFGAGPRLIALGGEVVVDYAIRLKAELGRANTWVMGYANDVMAYIPSERVLHEGGYEGATAMLYYGQPAPWAPGVERRIVREVHRQIKPAPLAAPSPLYHEHTDLTVYLDESHQPQLIKTPADWEKRREQILAGLQEAMGVLPPPTPSVPLDVKTVRESVANSVTVQEISFNADANERVPALLLIPAKSEGKMPGMLCLHQTTPLGKREPAGLGTRTNLHYARELALRGYVCLVPDYPSFGDHTPYNFSTSGYPSGTMRGIVNHRRAVDLLAAHPAVNAERLGVIGHSLGGHNAMFVAVFDPRLKVAVSSCGWTPFQDYYEGKIAGWTSDRYMPRLRTVCELNPRLVPFDFHEIVAALAPRAFFSNSPLHDSNFSVDGVRRAHAAARQIYRLLGAEDRLRVEYPDAGHDFPGETREAAYRFIDQHLKAGSGQRN